MKRITVLYISHNALLNGAPRSMLDMIDSLDQKEIRALAVIPSEGNLKRELQRRKIPFYIIPFCENHRVMGARNWKEELKKSFQNMQAMVRVIRLIRKEGVDIVHSNSTAADVGARAALFTRTPHVYHVRELMEEDFGWEYINKSKMKALLQKSGAVVSISKTVQEACQKKYGVRSIQIYNAVNIKRYYQPHGPFFADHKMKLLFCGGGMENKGARDAVQAVKILKDKKICSIELSIVGMTSTDYGRELKQYVRAYSLEQEVKFIPFVKDLSALRAKNDISLTCSRCEALGRVTIEAMLSGMCAVGADTGGTMELIGERGQYGYLYPCGHAEALACVLEQIYQNRDEAYRKAVDAQCRMKCLIDPAIYGKKIWKIYQRIRKV